MPASDLDDFIEAAVRALGIAIEADWKPAIAVNLATTPLLNVCVDEQKKP